MRQGSTMSVAKIALIFMGLLLCSCSQFVKVAPEEEAREEVDVRKPRWTVSEGAFLEMEKGEGSIEISLVEQKLTLRDKLGRRVIETDCSTGIPGRETPTGTFRIKEMIVDKRSNKYGRYLSKETGEVVVEKSWEVDRRPPGTRYLGIAMPYWMRLTWQGVGIHVGEFHRGEPSSFGCIRMPQGIQPRIYAKSAPGMPVRILR